MASAAIFSSLRRSRSPSLDAFLSPVDLDDNDVVGLLNTLTAVASDLILSFSDKTPPFQKRNSRSLLRRIELFVVLLDSVRDSGEWWSNLPSTLVLCFKELYLLLYRSKILLDYCTQSSKLWLLLQNPSISGHFHDLNQEISTLLDVFPMDKLNSLVTDDVREQIDLLQKQSRRDKLFIDKHDESLRLKFFNLLNEIGKGNIPNSEDFHEFFVGKLGILNARACRVEIEFLEEQIANHECDLEPSASVLGGFIAMIRYCRFLLFGFEEDEAEMIMGKRFRRMKRRGLISKEIADTFRTIQKDFCCPISLDLMMDPVIISTGQTFDRGSISRWIEEGHCNCPKTGQVLVHKKLVPNRALRNLIMQWCMAHKIPYSPPESSDLVAESFPAAPASRAAVGANKATVRLLIQQLENGLDCGKAIAAREIRFLAKTGRENRGFIAESGVIPHLKALLSSRSAVAQENAVTAMLNLSIYDKNKSRIVEEDGCLRAIVGVLRFGHTIESRENAAATLFSLSAVHDYKKRIADEDGALETLAGLLTDGTPRGKKDAVTAVFNLSTHTANCVKMIEYGVVRALVTALKCDGIAEEAAGALALIVRQPVGAEAVGNEEAAVVGLIGMMRCGTPRGKENAVAALLELCRSGGAHTTERVLKAPSLAGLIQSLLFTGTKRARRKAASLARVFQRCHYDSLHFNGLRLGYGFAGNSTAGNLDSGFPAETVSVSMSMSVSVS
ncbi:U-box domain-containing protein 17-like [Cynara cardunculus var. scolymus]|uniref:RING-type E3 ubiquitin transferase n=1 Tax=Cynara cardunculus var. scolymus TaxID=59895 RepID=A0A118JT15_CYNCS|nr:U-box domain-containing protein 17-like [Cynara cardunculus var. scolymus]KVH89456.1 Armadillo [Cynara cardunculus var. scolymus]